MNDFLGALASAGLRAFQTDDQRRAELLADIVAAGSIDDRFLDPDQFLTKPTVLRRLASELAGRVPVDVDRLVGREPDSLVLGAALALETGLPLVVVRTDPQPRCAGDLHPGERVLVVEVVTGTGKSAERVVEAVRSRGGTVAGVLAAVDRAAGAAPRLRGLGIGFDSVFGDADVRRAATRGRTP